MKHYMEILRENTTVQGRWKIDAFLEGFEAQVKEALKVKARMIRVNLLKEEGELLYAANAYILWQLGQNGYQYNYEQQSRQSSELNHDYVIVYLPESLK